jgi:hypothetical protein
MHPYRIKNAVLEKFGVPHTAQPLYNLRQHYITGIAVFKSFAGLEIKFLLVAKGRQSFL